MIIGEHESSPLGEDTHLPSAHLNGVFTGHPFIPIQSSNLSLQELSGHFTLF